jgi:hypothetical protein
VDELLKFLKRLNESSVDYMLGCYRDAVTVHVTASASERWEVGFFANGTIEVERFVSKGGRPRG